MARMGMAVHFTHLALVVLVMDSCFNRDETDEAEIKTEVKAALRMFESARDVSPLLGRSLSSLDDMLQKHNVHLNDTGTSRNDDQMQFTQHDPDLHLPGATLDTSLDQFWQIAVQSDPNLHSLAWNNLFSALDSRPM
jgi:hypothetical protein